LYPDLTVAENIRYSGDLRLIPPDEIADRSLQYLKMFDMDRFADRLAGQLSGGMKQKLALVCALVPQPKVLLLDEPTTGVDPVSRREFWDALAHLTTEGLTILVATPYLDEAERCHRIAFMHLGEILQIGTPTELCASLGAKRIELRTADLRKAESVLSEGSGPDKDIIDVQRFGDRLDLLVHDPDKEQKWVTEKLKGAGLSVDEMRVDEPTLDNIFVAKLRALARRPTHRVSRKAGSQQPARASCGRREESRQGVQRIHGCEECEPRDSKRRSIRTSRSEWGGQDNNHPDALRVTGTDKRNHGVGRHRWKPENGSCTQAHRLHVAEVLFV
jgi:ABC-type multidrug transport system ATPase subunit